MKKAPVNKRLVIIGLKRYLPSICVRPRELPIQRILCIVVPMNNYHTHTYLCQHAKGTVLDYAVEAKNNDISILGMTDHTPLPDGSWNWVRMSMSELEDYEAQIERAREGVPDLSILKGMECEWDPGYHGFYRDELLHHREFDYLIGAVHWYPFRGEWLYLNEIRTCDHLKEYTDLLIRTMESGLFSFIAHPDAFGTGYNRWDENSRSCSIDILEAAAELEIPLEINGYGFRKSAGLTADGNRRIYPLTEFWELASDFPIRAVCNSDAHRPEDVVASIDACRELALICGVPILETLPLRHEQLSAKTTG